MILAIASIGLQGLVGILISLVILICICLVLYWCIQRFAPDPLLQKILYLVIFIILLVGLLQIFGIASIVS